MEDREPQRGTGREFRQKSVVSNRQQAPGVGWLGGILEAGPLEILKPDAACEGGRGDSRWPDYLSQSRNCQAVETMGTDGFPED